MPLPTPLRAIARRPWTLAVAVILAACSAASTACGLQFSTGIEAKSTWSKNYKVGNAATLELKEPNGRINVEAVDGTEIQVVATRIAKASTEEEAKIAVEKIEIKEAASADRVEIDSTPAMPIRGFDSRRVDYDVKVPKTASLTIKNANGEINVRAVGGVLKIESTNGAISVAGTQRGTDITATNGKIDLDLAEVGPEGVRCRTTNGAITLTIPKSANARLAARVTNGMIDVDNVPFKFDDNSRRRLDATLGNGGPDVRLDTTNGYIKINGR